MPVIEVEIEVHCGICGGTLPAKLGQKHESLHRPYALPCPACLKTADETGFKRGYKQGSADAHGLCRSHE